METLKVKIKKLVPEAQIPYYAKSGDAGLDLTATSKAKDNNGNIEYGTGLSIEIPEGYVGFLFPRSSVSKKQLFLTNSVGVIDSGYRGEIKAKFKPAMGTYEHITDAFEDIEYNIGERVVQLIILPYPQVELVEVENLANSDRGLGGFGSTGK